MRVLLLERGFSYDVLDAVLAVPEGDILRVHHRILALSQFKHHPGFEDLMVVFNRCHNLARKAEQTEVDETIFTTEEEQTLYDRLQAEAPDMQVWLRNGEFEEYGCTDRAATCGRCTLKR